MQCLRGCTRDIFASVVSWYELVEGMCCGLEFIEDLWVGDCDPVEELGELFVGLIGRGQLDSQYVDLALNQVEVAVGREYRFLQSTGCERVAAAVSLFNGLG
jgi:hypothetical protein